MIWSKKNKKKTRSLNPNLKKNLVGSDFSDYLEFPRVGPIGGSLPFTRHV